MTKYDVKRDLSHLYAPKNTDWEIVDVPPQQFVSITGAGDPNTSDEYANAVAALYAVAYTIKFTSKNVLERDFVVGPLEGLWWADDYTVFTTREKSAWKWQLLINQPAWITPEMIEDTTAAAMAKKNNPAIGDVRRQTLSESTCAQVLHIGPYDAEAPTLAKLHDGWLTKHKYELSGLHHEIYLSDPRRTEPAKLKTVLRQPVRATSAATH